MDFEKTGKLTALVMTLKMLGAPELRATEATVIVCNRCRISSNNA